MCLFELMAAPLSHVSLIWDPRKMKNLEVDYTLLNSGTCDGGYISTELVMLVLVIVSVCVTSAETFSEFRPFA